MIDGCPFCDYAGPNTVLWETAEAYAVAPLREVTPGHTLIIPREHATDFADTPNVTAEAFRAAALYARENGIEDCNLITSKGPSATQTVKHVHIHVLPRTFDDAVRLPWNNPHESPSPTHHLYRRAERETDALLETLRTLRTAEGGRFEWEVDKAIGLVGHATRYLSKPGEVLYCNWTDCLHAKPQVPGAPYAPDYAGRAIPIGEGVQHFKGRIHEDCAEAMRARPPFDARESEGDD